MLVSVASKSRVAVEPVAVKMIVDSTQGVVTSPSMGTVVITVPSIEKSNVICSFLRHWNVMVYSLPASRPEMVLLTCKTCPLPYIAPYPTCVPKGVDVSTLGSQTPPAGMMVSTQFGLALGSSKLGLGITPQLGMTEALSEGLGDAEELVELMMAEEVELGISNDEVELGISDDVELGMVAGTGAGSLVQTPPTAVIVNVSRMKAQGPLGSVFVASI